MQMEAGSLKRAVEAMLLNGRLSTIHMPIRQRGRVRLTGSDLMEMAGW